MTPSADSIRIGRTGCAPPPAHPFGQVPAHPSRRCGSETGVLARVELEVPQSFPDKYRDALVRVADQRAVKKAIQAQPVFEVQKVVAA
jgi:hypothetical protein